MITDSFCFIHLERTGGQSVRSWVNALEIEVLKDIGESTARILPAERPFTFGFIRNPYDWYLSRYLFYCLRKKNGETSPSGQFSKRADKLIMQSETPPSFEKWFWHNVFRDRGRKPYTPYFKGKARKIPYFNMTFVVKDVFYDDDGRFLLDYLGDTAELSRHMNIICGKIGFPIADMPHVNKTEHKEAESYYTDKMKTYINKEDEFIFNLLDGIS